MRTTTLTTAARVKLYKSPDRPRDCNAPREDRGRRFQVRHGDAERELRHSGTTRALARGRLAFELSAAPFDVGGALRASHLPTRGARWDRMRCSAAQGHQAVDRAPPSRASLTRGAQLCVYRRSRTACRPSSSGRPKPSRSRPSIAWARHPTKLSARKGAGATRRASRASRWSRRLPRHGRRQRLPQLRTRCASLLE